MEQIFFTNWESLGRIVVVGVMVYLGLIVLLRTSGKRTLSKMNAFDLIVTVALGSMLASTLLSKSVALFDGLLGMGLLVALQYVITWLSVRYSAVDKLVKSEPTLLVYRGRFLHAVMKAERVTEGEILASLRERGIASLADAAAVVLENDGTLNALQNEATDAAHPALRGVPKPKP